MTFLDPKKYRLLKNIKDDDLGKLREEECTAGFIIDGRNVTNRIYKKISCNS
jgi:hypothetical protein